MGVLQAGLQIHKVEFIKFIELKSILFSVLFIMSVGLYAVACEKSTPNRKRCLNYGIEVSHEEAIQISRIGGTHKEAQSYTLLNST